MIKVELQNMLILDSFENISVMIHTHVHALSHKLENSRTHIEQLEA